MLHGSGCSPILPSMNLIRMNTLVQKQLGKRGWTLLGDRQGCPPMPMPGRRWAEELFLLPRQLHHQFVVGALGWGISLPSNFTIPLPGAGHRHCSSQPALAPGRIWPHGSPSLSRFAFSWVFLGVDDTVAWPALTCILLLLLCHLYLALQEGGSRGLHL